MKLSNFQIKSPVSNPVKAKSGFISKEAMDHKMRAYWADPANARLYPVGRLLAEDADGKSVAARMVLGEEVELDAINGWPLIEGFKLSLLNVGEWGCPVCGSAHGSGVRSSRKVSLNGLLSNEFYYNPVTKKLLTISETCFGSYVKALGALTEARFALPGAASAGLVKAMPPAVIDQQIAKSEAHDVTKVLAPVPPTPMPVAKVDQNKQVVAAKK